MARPSICPLLVLNAISAAMAAAAAAAVPPSRRSYPNVTLHSPVLSARVFMPRMGGGGRDRDADNENVYYAGSRFEHGSMIGDVLFGDREVYGRGLWRSNPHDPTWPESGVGLASEFGCGDDGATCVGKGDITNGVLGYDEAKPGQPFLKIGVGALVKGSCPECVGDENGVYRFNSPYKFHRLPVWYVLPSPGPNEVTFVSEERVGNYGYRIQKTARLDGNIMTVRSILTNLGEERFTTPWYSHHFFTGDDEPVGPGYVLDLGLSEYALSTSTPRFRQPGLGTWSADVNEYFNVTMASDKSISVSVKKVLPDGVKLKAEFLDDNIVTLTDGSFTLRAPSGISVYEKIPELQTQSRNPFIYAYNVYAERGTLSPEPTLLLYLEPGETTTWTQHLKFSSDPEMPAGLPFLSFFWSEAWRVVPSDNLSSGSALALLVACLGVAVAAWARFAGPRRRSDYSSIPDHASGGNGNALSVV